MRSWRRAQERLVEVSKMCSLKIEQSLSYKEA
jgi:hypothetical protein